MGSVAIHTPRGKSNFSLCPSMRYWKALWRITTAMPHTQHVHMLHCIPQYSIIASYYRNHFKLLQVKHYYKYNTQPAKRFSKDLDRTVRF